MIVGKGGSECAGKEKKRGVMKKEDKKGSELFSNFHSDTLQKLKAINNADVHHPSNLKEFDSQESSSVALLRRFWS